jgi:hypothetical protein
MRQGSRSLTLDKLAVAKRQIETAIRLWFENADPVSIHTLTAAAHRVVLDLLEHQGKSLAPFDSTVLKKGQEKEMKRMFREAETFFKHARDDPDKSLDFSPGWTDVYLLLAVHGYTKLIREENLLMTAYLLRWVVRCPELFAPDAQELARRDFDVKKLSKLPRGKFLEEITTVLDSR